MIVQLVGLISLREHIHVWSCSLQSTYEMFCIYVKLLTGRLLPGRHKRPGNQCFV